MGYYTRYKLEPEGDAIACCPTCGFSNHVSHRSQIAAGLDGYDPFGDSCKWYSWKEDMCAYSLKYPDTLFTISGEGEDSEDIWKAYFKNGKVQVEHATFQIASFDPSKLE